ncbi:MAG: hypothetical protein ACPG8W_21885, partial [Candidatus Promineifilaceae bacterium]
NYIVKAGRTQIVQFGTPYAQDNAMVASLDGWISDLMDRYPSEQLAWDDVGVPREQRQMQPPVAVEEAEVIPTSAPKPAEPVAVTPVEPEPKAPEKNKPDIVELRRQIEETVGFPVDTLGAEDIINVAISLGILEG